MSLVYITKHDESIYSLNKFDRAQADEDFALQIMNNTTGTRYISNYHKEVIKKNFDIINVGPYNKIVATKSETGYHKTMGYANQPLKSPCNFLRKNEGIKWNRMKEHVCGKALTPLPPIPKISRKKEKRKKNIVKDNVKNIKNTTIRRGKPKYVFTYRGDTHEICNSGIMPAYIFSPTFGKLPKYVLKYNKILCKKNKVCEDHQNEINSEYYLLPAEDRIRMLKGLKACWSQMQTAFQALPVVTDTILRVQRKTRLEKQLCQLEEDIMLVRRNPFIYVCA